MSQLSDTESFFISIIMVDGLFRSKFKAIDFFENQTFPKTEYEIIWVEYYDHVKPELEAAQLRYANFKVIKLGLVGQYHSSYCFNAGIMNARGKLIVLPDADVIAERDFLERIWQGHREMDNLVLYVYRYDEPKEKHSQLISLDHLREASILTNPFNYGGCLTVRRKWLMMINGYEQHPWFASGHHSNGKDIYTRFKNFGLPVKWHPELRLYHPWHPNTGTSYRYIFQNEIIRYRGLNLCTLPFQGIDQLKDNPPPTFLVQQVENIRRKTLFEEKIRLALKQPVSVIKKGLPASWLRFYRKVKGFLKNEVVY